MSREKSLYEALEEMDRWGDKVSEEIASLSPGQVVEYFRRAKADLEKKIGQQLDFPVRPAPKSRIKRSVRSSG